MTWRDQIRPIVAAIISEAKRRGAGPEADPAGLEGQQARMGQNATLAAKGLVFRMPHSAWSSPAAGRQEEGQASGEPGSTSAGF